MSMAEPLTALKAELIQDLVPQLVDKLAGALAAATPLHQVERQLWEALLATGRRLLGTFLDCHGTGDQGPTLTLADGEELRRLAELHTRRYVSIFGAFALARTVYGSREGQAVAFVPLDNRLQLPQSPFSYLLQDWDQALAVEQAFGCVNETIARMLQLRQSVDSLETMNRQMAEDVNRFQEERPVPPAAEEGTIVVATADCKGVVIRGQGTPTICGGERPSGQRANQKRMAAVGAVYTVDPYVRTADEVVAALFHDSDSKPRPRPKPCHKHVWATLPDAGPAAVSSIDKVFGWLQWEWVQRQDNQKATVYLCDGQEALWQACDEYLPDDNAVKILDLLHVTPRLWAAGKLLYGAKSTELICFVRHRVKQILEGKVESVLRGLRRLAVERKLPKVRRVALKRILRYLSKNRYRMRYDEYLANGYPIASGVIEGACRHLVKDRMERAGMHWTLQGAQAMLDLRSVYIEGQWEKYQTYRVAREAERLYPHRELVAGEAYLALAP
jgi:hypothetical protein